MYCMWWAKDERADKTKEGLGMQDWKIRPLSSFPPPCCNYYRISGPPEQYNLSPLLPHREKAFAFLSPHAVYVPHPISKWPGRPLSHSLCPRYKSELRTPVQRRFSLELAHCSNSVSHSNKLYFPLILLSGNFFPTRAWTTTIWRPEKRGWV